MNPAPGGPASCVSGTQAQVDALPWAAGYGTTPLAGDTDYTNMDFDRRRSGAEGSNGRHS
jgi:hypothetical protein